MSLIWGISPRQLTWHEALPIGVVAAFFLLAGAYLNGHRVLLTNPVTEIQGVTVIREVPTYRSDAWRYEFADKDGNRFYQDICKDYVKPEFDVGLRIRRLIYVDLDDLGQGCWSLDPDKHAGYFKERTPDGKPVYVEVK